MKDAQNILKVSTLIIAKDTPSTHSWCLTQDSNDIQQYFSSEWLPMLWCALPTLEQLQTAWEEKQDSDEYALYKDAIKDG
jgi:hypothetical protein